MTASDGHLNGVRVRILRWAVDDKPDAVRTDERGLMYDAAGAVIGVDDNYTVPPGTEGIAAYDRDAVGQIHVWWDNGSRLAMLPGRDQYEVVA